MSDEQIKAIPQGYIDMRASTGGALKFLTDEQIKAIPQYDINQRVARGCGALGGLTDEQIKAIPQDVIDLSATNGLLDDNDLTAKQLKAIPKEILKPTDNDKKALILYGAQKLTSQDLPLNVFVNPELRNALLLIIEESTKKQFNTICEKNGFESNTPDELVQSFNERVISIHDEISKRQMDGLKELQEQRQSNLNNAIGQTKNLTW